MSIIYKSCIKCGYLYNYNSYICCPECGAEQVVIKEKDKDDINKKESI